MSPTTFGRWLEVPLSATSPEPRRIQRQPVRTVNSPFHCHPPGDQPQRRLVFLAARQVHDPRQRCNMRRVETRQAALRSQVERVGRLRLLPASWSRSDRSPSKTYKRPAPRNGGSGALSLAPADRDSWSWLCLHVRQRTPPGNDAVVVQRGQCGARPVDSRVHFIAIHAACVRICRHKPLPLPCSPPVRVAPTN